MNGTTTAASAAVHERTRLLPSRAQSADQRAGTTAADPDRNNKSWKPTSPKFWLLVVGYSSLLFLFSSNATGITTIYPFIAESLRAYDHAATWIITAYMIAASCTTPLVGRLSTIFRPTNVFIVSTASFAVGQLLAGLAPSVGIFIAGRVLTGCGSGGLFTTVNVLLIEAAPVHRRGVLLGIINCVVTCGSSLGGVIGGAFAVSSYGWRPAFIIQAPIATIAAIIVYFFSPSPPPKLADLSLRQRWMKVDYLGIFTLSASLILLLTSAMASSFSYKPLLGGLLALVAFVLVEAKVSELPIIPVSLLSNPATLFGCFCSLFGMTARWVLLYYSPIWAMAVLGFHPTLAGATLIPTSVGFGLGGLIVGAYSVRHAGGYYWQSLVSLALFTMTYVAFYLLALPASINSYVLLLVLNGLGAGAVLVYTLAHILSTTHEKAIVTSLYNTFRGLAPSFGAGIAGGILQRRLQKSMVASISEFRPEGKLTPDDWNLIARLKGSPTLVWQLRGWQKEVGMQAYEYAIRVIFLVAVMAGVLAFIAQLATYTRPDKDNGGKDDSQDDEDPFEDRILDD